MSIIHHKLPQTTPNHHQMTTNDHKTHASNYKLPQTTNKRLQTIKKKRTVATSKQTATPVHQTKYLTFCFSFPYSVVTMNTTILKSILFTVPNKWCGGGGGSPNPKGAWEVWIVVWRPTKVSSIIKRGMGVGFSIKGRSDKIKLI